MEPLSTVTGVSEAFAERFRQRAGSEDTLPFSEFMRLALYDPTIGYYTSHRRRVGKEPGTDFQTASDLRLAFGPLVVAAVVKLLGEARAAEHVFVEIGAEPGGGVLDGGAHPFREVRSLRLGAPLDIPSPAVVFSNELFDAQPFARVVFLEDRWQEMGVRLGLENELSWTPLPALTPPVREIGETLPAEAAERHIIDLPLESVSLLASIAGGDWKGLFLAFDYGRSWQQIRDAFPNGTGRGYRDHRQTGSLLDAPGEQDLTCHVCWDWLENGLRSHGFSTVTRTGQESFFVKHAADAIGAIFSAHADPFDPARSQVKQLLHPGLMGQRFEALWGLRG